MRFDVQSKPLGLGDQSEVCLFQNHVKSRRLRRFLVDWYASVLVCFATFVLTVDAIPQMGRFFVYEEYGAKYESMLLEMTSTSKTIPNFQIYERGIEALAHSLASTSTRTSYSRKGMTFEDLLIKVCQKLS